MFRRSTRGTASIQLHEVHGVRTHAQRAAARIERARTEALSLGALVR